MMPPAAMAIAALTVMLWILWSDTLRKRRGPAAFYALRVALFIICAAILVMNRVRYPRFFSPAATVLVAIAALVGLAGAVYFGLRLVRRI
jgi:glucan phosphoethanolaminetransferase (alkaline phosphatase superfamily)